MSALDLGLPFDLIFFSSRINRMPRSAGHFLGMTRCYGYVHIVKNKRGVGCTSSNLQSCSFTGSKLISLKRKCKKKKKKIKLPNPCLFTLAFIYKNTFLLPLEFTPIFRLLFTVVRFSTNGRLKTWAQNSCIHNKSLQCYSRDVWSFLSRGDTHFLNLSIWEGRISWGEC